VSRPDRETPVDPRSSGTQNRRQQIVEYKLTDEEKERIEVLCIKDHFSNCPNVSMLPLWLIKR